MEIYAFFIWPAIVFGVLIAYGYIASRKPKTAEDRQAEDERALADARELRQQIEDLTVRIEAMQAQMAAEDAAMRAEVLSRRAHSGQFIVRSRIHKERALVARYVHGT